MGYCKKCGEKLPEDAEFCPNCGTRMIKMAPTKRAHEPASRIIAQRGEISRPVTVAVVAILLFIIGGLSIVLAGISIASIASIAAGTAGTMLAIVVFLSLLLGVVELAAGYGVWRMRRWGAEGGITLSIVAFVLDGIGLVLGAGVSIGILLDIAFYVPILAILAYEWRSFR